MRKYVRIQDGSVVESLEIEGWIYDLFPEFMVWIEVTGMDPLPVEFWLYDGFAFSPPPPIYIDPRPEILAELEKIDRDSARPLRVMIIADPDVGIGTPERAELEAMELRAIELRAQLAALDEE